jgi:hypothetical protein
VLCTTCVDNCPDNRVTTHDDNGADRSRRQRKGCEERSQALCGNYSTVRRTFELQRWAFKHRPADQTARPGPCPHPQALPPPCRSHPRPRHPARHVLPNSARNRRISRVRMPPARSWMRLRHLNPVLQAQKRLRCRCSHGVAPFGD